MRRYWVSLVILLAMCPGCTKNLPALVDALNERQAHACYKIFGAYAGSGILVLMATGGATLEQCNDLR